MTSSGDRDIQNDLEETLKVAAETFENDDWEWGEEGTETAAASTEKPKRTYKRKFVDYDLSQITDTKGGYFLPNASTKAKQEEEAKKKIIYEHTQLPLVNIVDASRDIEDIRKEQGCKDCGSLQLDAELFTHYHIHVCSDCRQDKPDKYSLLTKSEAKQDYLLTDEELRDTSVMPFWQRPNPHKKAFADMKLYLREQVEQFSFKKWGGEEGLDKEYERRVNTKQAKKQKEFKQKMSDLKKRTRTSVWAEKKEEQHRHEFIDDGNGISKCITCGLQVEVETL
jgi:DNA-repair protein complementing XP-A cells